MSVKKELIITILFGWLGVHKFIKKKYVMGVLYLFSFGLYTIGWIVDVIIILNKFIKEKSISSTPIHTEDVNNEPSIEIKKEEIKESSKEINEIDKIKNKYDELLNYVYATNFNVVGITFENRTSNLKKIIKNHVDAGYIEKYDGMKPKDIKESYDKVGEYADQYLTDTILEKYKYKDEDAIRIKINNLDGEYLDVGNVPKDEVQELIPYLDDEKYKIKINSKIVGGKYKQWDDIDEEWIYEELNYGIEITIAVYNK